MDLIENKLLVISIKARANVETILKHVWFQNDRIFINNLQCLQKKL